MFDDTRVQGFFSIWIIKAPKLLSYFATHLLVLPHQFDGYKPEVIDDLTEPWQGLHQFYHPTGRGTLYFGELPHSEATYHFFFIDQF